MGQFERVQPDRLRQDLARLPTDPLESQHCNLVSPRWLKIDRQGLVAPGPVRQQVVLHAAPNYPATDDQVAESPTSTVPLQQSPANQSRVAENVLVIHAQHLPLVVAEEQLDLLLPG